MRPLRLALMMEERVDSAVFGLIGTPKSRIEKRAKLFLDEFKTVVCIWSITSARASATGILIGMLLKW